MNDLVTQTSRRMSRDRHAVTHADVTPVVTVPPPQPDPTHKYLKGSVDLQTNASLRASRVIGLATR